MKKQPISYYKERARDALRKQWGINAGLVLLAYLITTVIQSSVDGLLNFPEGSRGQLISDFLLSNLLLFAFYYGLNYIALYVIRGGRAKPGMLFAIFDKKYYLPMLLLNLISTVATWLVNSLVFLPLIFMGGVFSYVQLVTGNSPRLFLSNDFVIDFNFIIMIFIFLLVALMLLNIIGGLFQIASWVKLDYPELSVGKSISYAWFLLKDRLWKYILLQLSFIGWYLISVLTLFIGLLWVVSYVNVSMAAFYDYAREEKGMPERYLNSQKETLV
ncbi:MULTISPECIES: DUF975 family protein [unclassified Enterococcus]|jgi:uncharacterized membrane protein|uniref:DUF975 family protein n=1 Tax=unclassified Enterococcus TaxID=2608891 RepID=UPI003D2894C9